MLSKPRVGIARRTALSCISDGLRSRVLEHRQLPVGPTFVESQNIQISVVVLDLEVAAVTTLPLIDVFDDLGFAPIKMKLPRHFNSAITDVSFDVHPRSLSSRPIRVHSLEQA